MVAALSRFEVVPADATRDLADIVDLQAAAYPPHLHECAETLRTCLTDGGGRTSYVCRSSASGLLLGYVLVHAWNSDAPPTLGAPLQRRGDGGPDGGDGTAFVHDLCVAPAAQRTGVGSALLRAVVAEAEADACAIRCVAVAGAAGFWTRRGFERVGTRPALPPESGYGEGAELMELRCYIN